MKKKFILGLIICLSCAVLVLTGCESKEESGSRKNENINIESTTKSAPTDVANTSKNTANSTAANATNTDKSSTTNTNNTNKTNNSNSNTSKEYTEEELSKMALEYYEKKNGYRPGHSAAEKNDSGMVTIQLYDSFSDHNSTCDWYTINPKTGKGTNTMGEEIDLTPYAK